VIIRLKRNLILAKIQGSMLLARFRQRVVGPHASHVLTDSFNGKLLVPVSDFEVGRKLAFKGEYDRAHIEKLLQLVNEESNVLIVGAHVGSLVIPIAKAVREVVAIEANPATFDTLRMNLAINDCRNVRALNVAASDKHEKVRFLASIHNSGGSKIAPANFRREFVYDHPKTVEVDAAPLDELLPDFSPSHIVMDVEGAEARAMVGMRRLLASTQVFIVEFLPNHIENVAGISCHDFLKLIPFEHIQLLDEPEEQHVVEAARSRHYYGGADLLCTHSA
jgi:FkbM family methyltransferase